MLNQANLDGEPILVEVQTPSVKLSESPGLVIAIPCGDKQDNTSIVCPEDVGGCGQKFLLHGTRVPLLVPIRSMLKLNNLVKPLNMVTATIVEAGRLSSEARQIMTKKALRMGAKYILYMDDDTMLPDDGLALYKLINFLELNPDVGAVTGIVPTRVDPPEITIYQEHGAGAFWNLPMGPGAVPQPIFGCGGAFLLARLSAVEDTIEQLEKENGGNEVAVWADEMIVDEDSPVAHMLGHDVRFAHLMNKCGHPVYAHGAVLCGHLDVTTNIVYEVPADAPGMLGPRDLTSKSATPDVDVIMVKYNQPGFEDNTLEAVRVNTTYPSYRVVAHQNSKDVSLSKCWNDLIRKSDAEYICLLNSDTAPAKDWLTKLMVSIRREDVGAVVPSSNKVHISQIETSLDSQEMNLDVINEFAGGLQHKEESIMLASAMCIVFPKAIWEALGGFDEDFDFYGGDTWFSWGIGNLLDKDIVWVKDAYVHHYGSQSALKAAKEEGFDCGTLREEATQMYKDKVNAMSANEIATNS